MNYWLLKSEPNTYSVDDLAEEPQRTTHWDGVRNFQARNILRDRIKKGDRAFFYHSSCATPAIVGIVEVTRHGYPDFTAFDPDDAHYDPKGDPANPRWYMVDVRLKRRLKRDITLSELRSSAGRELRGLELLRRGSRLSVMPVSREHWNFILSLERVRS